jgi:hypothetical protein
LTFSEALSTLPGLTTATWGAATAAYKVDGAKLYVYPPASLTTAPLNFSVAAAADTSNTATQASTGGISITGLTFSTEAPFALSLVNGSAPAAPVSIAQDGDIILDFNKDFDPVSGTLPTPASATLYFTYSGFSAVTAVAGTVAGSRSLKITPANLLAIPASGVTYAVRYEATSGGVKIAGTISVTVTAATNPTKSLASISGTLAINGTVNASDNTVGVVYTPAAVPPFAQNYTITRIEYVAGANNVWDGATSVGSYSVSKGAAAGSPLTAVVGLSLPGITPHTNAENIKFRLEGVSATGYAAASNVVSISFN